MPRLSLFKWFWGRCSWYHRDMNFLAVVLLLLDPCRSFVMNEELSSQQASPFQWLLPTHKKNLNEEKQREGIHQVWVIVVSF